mgnify:FL=1
MKKALNGKEEINENENIIIEKVCTYYNEKYEKLSIEEKKELFHRMIIEGNVKQQFDNNEFYKILTPEEQKNAQKIEYWDYITFLQESFGFTKMSESIKLGILTEKIKDKNKFNEEHIKEIKLYRDILELYKNIALELKLSTALEFSYYYTYLLWNGYFSVTKEHEYNEVNRSNDLNFLATSILNGSGVCLEHSALLNDFLKVCNKESLLMSCFVPRKKGEVIFEYKPNIVRNINKNTKKTTKMLTILANASGIIKKLGNHAVTVINENGQQFVFDATNLSVLNIEDKLMASIINGKGYFYLKKNSLDLFNLTDCTDELFYMLKREIAHSSLEKNNIISGYENTLKIVEKNRILLDEGYNSIHSSIEQISSHVLSKKKK